MGEQLPGTTFLSAVPIKAHPALHKKKTPKPGACCVSYEARVSRLQTDVVLGPAGADGDPNPGSITGRDRGGRTEALSQVMQRTGQRNRRTGWGLG